jgi:hypothetical protein
MMFRLLAGSDFLERAALHLGKRSLRSTVRLSSSATTFDLSLRAIMTQLNSTRSLIYSLREMSAFNKG